MAELKHLMYRWNPPTHPVIHDFSVVAELKRRIARRFLLDGLRVIHDFSVVAELKH